MQKTLSSDQVMNFYHDLFVADQAESFIYAMRDIQTSGKVVVDVGGGCGYFASAVAASSSFNVRVMDMDPVSVASCRSRGIEADVTDALQPVVRGDESVVCFNLMLHHLVGASERDTLGLQTQALKIWHPRTQYIFVNEYIYESLLCDDLSGRLIWRITSSKLLSSIAQSIARFVPSLQANTFGVGVRFRSSRNWKKLFESLGYEVIVQVTGIEEDVSLARRLLFIKRKRRDSFLLRPTVIPTDAKIPTRIVELSRIRQSQETG